MTSDPYHRETYPLLVVISGPSGVGKDAVRKRMQERGCPFHFVVTATDRPQRPGEVHGKDYFFISAAEFDRMLANGELLEHAIVYGQHKGIPKAHVRQALTSGQDVLMRVDVQGATTIRRLVPEAVLIFLMPSSEEELIRRLRRLGGGADSPSSPAENRGPGSFADAHRLRSRGIEVAAGVRLRGRQSGEQAGRHRGSDHGHHHRREVPCEP